MNYQTYSRLRRKRTGLQITDRSMNRNHGGITLELDRLSEPSSFSTISSRLEMKKHWGRRVDGRNEVGRWLFIPGETRYCLWKDLSIYLIRETKDLLREKKRKGNEWIQLLVHMSMKWSIRIFHTTRIPSRYNDKSRKISQKRKNALCHRLGWFSGSLLFLWIIYNQCSSIFIGAMRDRE